MKKTIKKQPNFLEWNNNIFISSIKKIDSNIILIVVLDALFYLLSGYIVIYWLQRIQLKMSAIAVPVPEQLVSLGYDKAQQVLNEARTVYYLIIFSAILLLVAIIFVASIFKGIIWAKTTNTRISFALISRFLGLNLAWMGFWFTLVFLISLFVQPSSAPMFMLSTIILGLYFSNTLYTIFMKKQEVSAIRYTVKLNIKKASSSSIHDLLVATKLASIDFLNTLKQIQIFTSIRDTIKLNITKIHMFLLPYVFIFALLYIVSKLFGLIKFRYSPILLGLLLLVYAAVVRYYVSELVLEIDKAK